MTVYTKGSYIKNKKDGRIAKITDDFDINEDKYCYTTENKLSKECVIEDYELVKDTKDLLVFNFGSVNDTLLNIGLDYILKRNFIKFSMHEREERYYDKDAPEVFATIKFSEFDDTSTYYAKCRNEYNIDISIKEMNQLLLNKIIEVLDLPSHFKSIKMEKSMSDALEREREENYF